MKNRVLLTIATLLLLVTNDLLAQVVPQGFTYQAVVRDGTAANQLLTGTIEVRFTILQGGSTEVYQETQSKTLNQFGLFSAVVGDGLVVSGDFSTIDWSLGNYNVRVEVDAGSGYTNLGITQLQSVPYSLYAEKAGSIDNLNLGIGDLSDVIAPAPVPGEVLVWDGTQWVPGNAGTTNFAGDGITIVNDTIINTGDLNGFDDILIGDPAGGDLSGTYPAPTVMGLGGNPISTNVPLVGEILKWDGTEWVPSVDDAFTLPPGSVNVTQRLTGDGSAGTPLDLAQNGAFPNQTLKWNGASWAPANDEINDADNNPNNEIQSLSLSGTVLSLSNGGGAVSLPGGGSTYSPGTGISILGSVITNTGDTNPIDDITTSTAAGGDLFGTYPAPEVVRIRGISITSNAPTPGQVLKYDGVQWDVDTDEINDADSDPNNEIQALSLTGNLLQLSNGGGLVNLPTYLGGTGISVIGTIINNTGDTDPTNDITTSTIASGDLSGLYPSPKVEAIQGFPVASLAPATNQVMAWNGGQWAPFTDPDSDPQNELQTLSIIGNTLSLSNGGGSVGVPIYSGGTGISVTGTTINNTGDLSTTNEIQSLSIFGTTIALSNGGGNVTLPYVGGTGIDISGATIVNTGDTNPLDDITTSTVAQGDLEGNFPDPTVRAIQNNPVASGTPDPGDIMVWNGANWEYEPDPDRDPSNEIQNLSIAGTTVSLSNGGGSINLPYTGGSGITISGTTITNIGDTDPSNDLIVTTNFGGDIDGVFSGITVTGIQGEPVSSTSPIANQVLKYIGGQWVPSSDANTTYSAGTGIAINGSNAIINTGDTNASDDITTATPAGGDLTGTYPNVSVLTLQGAPLVATGATINQVLGWNGTTWAPFTDGDANSANEIQALSLTGTTISLSNGGGSVVLPYTGTAGIDITGSTISNTGDLDPLNDVLVTDNAGGDLTGTFSNLSIANIQGNPVLASGPGTGQYLGWSGFAWIPTTDPDADPSNEIQSLSISGTTISLTSGGSVALPYVGGTGINISGATVVNTGDTDASDDITTSTLAAGDVSGTYPTLTVEGLNGVPMAAGTLAPSNDEILKFNSGTGEWELDTDDNTEYTASTGIDVTAGVITNTGDTNAADDITTSSTASGDASGTFSTLSVTGLRGNALALGVGAPVAGNTLEFNGTEWALGTDDNTTYAAGTGLSLTGTIFTNTGDTDASDDLTTASTAGGDASGAFSALSVTGLRGNGLAIGVASPSNDDILRYDSGSSTWVLSTDENTEYTASTGIDITGTTITNTGDTDASDDLTTASTAGGDASGAFSGLTVTGLQGTDVATTAPSNNEVLRFNSGTGEWEPTPDVGTVYSASTGIDITGTVITNTGDTDASDDLTTASTAGGDASGAFSALSVNGLRGNALAVGVATPSNDEILKYNAGSGQWVLSSDANTEYTASTGIDITGTVVTNTGDTDASDDLTTASTAAGDAAGAFSALTVTGLQGTDVSTIAPSNNEVLKFNSGTGEWEPAADAGGTYTGSTGIDVTGNVITNIGDTDASDDLTTASTAGGDASGAFSALSVTGLRGNPMAVGVASPLDGNILVYDNASSSWVLGADANTEYTASTGIDITGTTITNTGDTDASDDLTTASTAGGDASGAFSALTVTGLRGDAISATAPGNGEVLKFNSGTGEWEPATDAGTVYTASTGIDVTGTVITNTGDTDASDDLTTASTAGGDAAGAFSALSVTGLRGNPMAVGVASPLDGNILVYDNASSSWVLGADANTEYTASTGIDITGTTITNTGDTDASDDLTTASTAGGDASGAFSALSVTGLRGDAISATAPGNGEVLKFNSGTGEWEPATDAGTVYTASTGIDVTGTVITNTGDTDASDDLTTASTAGGDASGAFSALSVTGLRGNPMAVGVATPADGNTLIYDAGSSSWILGTDENTEYTGSTGIDITGTVVTNTGDTDASDDLTTASTAGGDASGAFSALSVTGLRGDAISATAPGNGEVLKFNSGTGEWEPATDAGTVYSASTGIDITGTVITNTGDTDASDDLTTASTAGGDASGAFSALSVTGLRGNPMAVGVASPTDGNILVYDNASSSWVLGADANTEYTASTGIDITGTTITNTGDTDASDDLTTASTAGGDASGAFSALSVTGLRGDAISTTAPGNGEVLKFNSGTGEWEPATDAGTVYSASTGIDITGTVITNTGDTDASDDLTTASTAGGDASGAFSALSVTGLRGNPMAVGVASPTDGNILVYDNASSSWVLGADANTEYTASTGIDITGTTITNTGDTDASDDLTTASTAGGDASGAFSALSITGLRGDAISATAPGNGQVLKFNSGTSEWEPVADENTTYAAGTGLDLVGTTFANTGDTDASDDITTSTLAAGDVSGTYPTLTIAGIQGVTMSGTAPANGQVIKYNSVSSQWEPGADNGNLFTAGTGIDVSLANVITNTGDTDASDDITTATAAAGDVSGTYPTLTVSGLSGNAFTAGVAAPVVGNTLEFDGADWALGTDDNTTYTASTGIDITAGVVTNTGDTDASDDLTTASTAGGDASGAFSALSVNGLRGNALAVGVATPADGNILVYNNASSSWVLGADANTEYTASTGIDITAGVVTNTGDTDASDDLTTASTAGGDASGAFSALSVTGLRGDAISTTAPSNGEVLKFNSVSGEWEPATDAGNTYTASTGIDVTGTVITNTGDTDASNDITTATAAAGDVAGTYPTLTVDGIQGVAIAAAVGIPADGNTLEYNAGSSSWVLGTDDGATYTASTGIDVTGTVITNTGDTDASDDLTTASTAGGDASGAFSALSVTGLRGNALAVGVATPADGNILVYNTVSSSWVLGSDANTEYTASTGIDITAGVVTNTGDTDASDDLTTASTAGGDATGAFSALTVTGLRGDAISTTAPSNDEVLKFNSVSGEWEPAADESATYTGSTGIDITGTVITNTGDTDASNDITTSTAAAGDVSGTYPTLSVAGIQGVTMSGTAPANGQVIKYNSGTSQWEPGPDNGNAFTAGTGISINGSNVITNAGDADASDDITTATAAAGDVSGTYPTLTVDGIQGVAVAAAAATPANGNGLVYNSGTTEWELSAVDADASDDITTATAAAGDVAGTYPTLTVDGIQGVAVAAAAATPANGNGLVYNSGTTEWELSAVDADASDDITTATAAAGDVAGTYPTLTVDGIQGVAVAAAAATPANGNGLVYNSGTTEWELSAVDTDASDDLTTASTAGGDASGLFSALSVTGLRGNVLAAATATPANDDLLKYNNVSGEWELGTDANTTYTAGTGISLTGGGTVITNTGVLTTTTVPALSDVSGTFGTTLTVTGLRGTNVVATAPATANVLRFDGTDWAPGTVSVTELVVDGDMAPDTDNVYDLGTTLLRYNDAFVANGVTTTSDLRLKDEVKELNYGLTEILRLRPVSYQWKGDDNATRKLGLIAQEILPVMKEVVNVPNAETKDAPLGVYYSDLIPVLIKGMQEQQGMMEGQQTVIDRQQQLIEMLEARISELETK